METANPYPKLGQRLPHSFFQRPCVAVARDLVGCYLARTLDDGTRLVARLVEVEAYLGDGTDPASHAHRGETRRNRTMFGPAGRLYVYLSHGIHACANVICTGRSPAGVLLRAAEPVAGVEIMRENRGLDDDTPDAAILRGPGNLCKALGIDVDDDGESLLSGAISLHRPSNGNASMQIMVSTRIGITQAVGHPYRFFAANNPHVSGSRHGSPVRRRGSRLTKGRT